MLMEAYYRYQAVQQTTFKKQEEVRRGVNACTGTFRVNYIRQELNWKPGIL